MTRFTSHVAGMTVLLLLAGCGDKSGGKTAVVSGSVKIAGKGPLPGGTITFVPATGSPMAAEIKGDGTYQVPGVPLGDYKVTVDNTNLKALGSAPGTAGSSADLGGGGAKYVKIDPKFAKPETSGLSTSVTGSTHVYDAEVK